MLLAGWAWRKRSGSKGIPGSLGRLGRFPEGVEVGVLAKTEEHLRPRCRVHDVVGLVLRVRDTEDHTRVLLRRMALDREVTALERVQVVEADRKGGAEARGDVRPEDLLARRRHQELEANPDDLVTPEQENALGRDELVRPGEVRRVRRDPERAS